MDAAEVATSHQAVHAEQATLDQAKKFMGFERTRGQQVDAQIHQ
jgi:hypothetical protein